MDGGRRYFRALQTGGRNYRQAIALHPCHTKTLVCGGRLRLIMLGRIHRVCRVCTVIVSSFEFRVRRTHKNVNREFAIYILLRYAAIVMDIHGHPSAIKRYLCPKKCRVCGAHGWCTLYCTYAGVVRVRRTGPRHTVQYVYMCKHSSKKRAASPASQPTNKEKSREASRTLVCKFWDHAKDTLRWNLRGDEKKHGETRCCRLTQKKEGLELQVSPLSLALLKILLGWQP